MIASWTAASSPWLPSAASEGGGIFVEKKLDRLFVSSTMIFCLSLRCATSTKKNNSMFFQSRTSSHAAASTSSPFSRRQARICRSSGPCWTRKTTEPPRALPKQDNERSNGDRAASLFLPLALAVAACLGPLSLPSLAENVRVEDVESPALRAGLEAANEQRWADAERLFKAYLLEAPDSASGLSNLANVELSTGRPQRALEHFDRAVELAPRAAVPRMNRALAKEALAVAAAAESKGGGGGSSGGVSSSSSELLLASAADDARQASLLDSKEFAAFYDLGNILERQGDFVGALGAFTEAADLAPGLPGYRLREATSMFQVAVDSEEAGSLPASSAASFTKARRLVEGVARKNPRYAEARAALAAMHWKAGDVAAAEGALDSAVGLEGEWRKPGHAAKATRWPPRLVEAYERLLAIE